MHRLRVIPCVLTLTIFQAGLIAGPFLVSNLVSNIPAFATNTDPNLQNAWGLATSATSPFWVGSNGAGLSTLYNSAGTPQPLVVTIPGDGSVTGVTFNGGGGGSFNGDIFLFASEDGTISGWRGALGTNAETLVLANPSNIYKGITQAVVGTDSYAYSANFRAGTIDVLKGNPAAPNLPGSLN